MNEVLELEEEQQDNEVLVKVVKDIIDMKMECNNVDEEDTLEDMLDQYTYALLTGHVEIIYRYGKLMAFIDWVRLPYVPESRDFTYKDIDTEHGGPVIYIMNCCVQDDTRHKYLWQLIHKVRSKNKGIRTVCWHERDASNTWVLKLFTNMKEVEK